MTVKKEVLQALKTLQKKQSDINIYDIITEMKRQRVLNALQELEKEGKVRRISETGRWEAVS